MKDLIAQKFLSKLTNGKKLKEIKLVGGFLKYKQINVYMPQGKLKLLIFEGRTQYSHSWP
jgi:hypothetical protein